MIPTSATFCERVHNTFQQQVKINVFPEFGCRVYSSLIGEHVTCLNEGSRNLQNFRRGFGTVAETWINHYTSETEGQFKQRLVIELPAQKKWRALLQQENQ